MLGEAWAGVLLALLLTALGIYLAPRIPPPFGSRAADGAAPRRVTFAGGAAIASGVVVVLATSPSRLAAAFTLAAALAVAAARSSKAPERLRSSPGRFLAPLAGGVVVAATDLSGASPGSGLVAVLLLAIAVAVVCDAVSVVHLPGRDILPVGIVAIGSVAILASSASDGTAWAGIVGALAGIGSVVLVAHGRPRPLLLGDSARGLLAFLFAAVAVHAPISSGAGLDLPATVLLAAVPLANLAAIAVKRFERRSGAGPRGGELVLRLQGQGLPERSAVVLLLGGQTALAMTLALRASGALAGAVVASLVLAAGVVVVVATRPARRIERSGRKVAWLLAPLGAIVLFVLPAVIALVSAYGQGRVGALAAERAIAAVNDTDQATAMAEFTAAEAAFSEAQDRLTGPLSSLGLAVPVLSANLESARTLADVARQLASAGAQVAAASDVQRLAITGGRVPIEHVEEIGGSLRAAIEVMGDAQQRIEAIPDDRLLSVLIEARDSLATQLGPTLERASETAEIVRLVPAIFGEDGARRYFLAVQNQAEARATGGVILSFGELVAVDGTVSLERFGRVHDLNDGGTSEPVLTGPEEYLERYGAFEPATTWQNVNLSPDFPTVGQVIAELYPQSGGQEVDGVLAVSPKGLAALLELVGPVSVEGWPVPIDAENVVEVTLHDAYEVFAKTDRVEFLGDVAAAVVERLSSEDLEDPVKVFEVLGEAVRQRQLIAYLVRPDEQALLDQIGASGSLEPPTSDSLLVVNQNAGSNKLDYYLRRHLRYEATLSPSAEGAQVDARLDVTLENQAPSEGLDSYVLGPNIPELTAGENRTIVSVFTPLSLGGATLDGEPVALTSGVEAGHQVHQVFLDIAAESSATLSLDLAGTVSLEAGNWYTLDLVRQPLLAADEVEVLIEAAPGWRIAEVVGAEETVSADGSTAVLAELSLDADEAIRVRLDPARP